MGGPEQHAPVCNGVFAQTVCSRCSAAGAGRNGDISPSCECGEEARMRQGTASRRRTSCEAGGGLACRCAGGPATLLRCTAGCRRLMGPDGHADAFLLLSGRKTEPAGKRARDPGVAAAAAGTAGRAPGCQIAPASSQPANQRRPVSRPVPESAR